MHGSTSRNKIKIQLDMKHFSQNKTSILTYLLYYVMAAALNDTNNRPGLFEAWLALTSVKYHGNVYIGLIPLKDGAYYCYCAYVLRVSRYSDFLSPMLTNTGIFLRGLKLSGESRS